MNPAVASPVSASITLAPPQAKLPDVRPVALHDKPLMDGYFSRYPIPLNMYTFASMYLWSEQREHRFCIADGHLFVSRFSGAQQRWYCPVGPDPVGMIKKYLDPCNGTKLSYLTEDIIRRLDVPAERISTSRDNCDYIFGIQQIIALDGTKYASKRNYIRRFCAALQTAGKTPQIFFLTQENADACIGLYEEWLTKKEKPYPQSLTEEMAAFKLAIAHFTELELVGVGIRIDGKLEAFSIGDALGTDMLDEMFEKTSHTYVGINQFLLHEVTKKLAEKGFVLINRAIDGGIPGLRESKEQWRPVKLEWNYWCN